MASEYLCGECDFSTSVEKALQSHFKREHEGPEPNTDWGYPCLINGCSDELKSRDSLGRHIAKKHPETLSYNDPEELERLYREEGLSQEEIAKKLGTSPGRISVKMNRFGIETDFGCNDPVYNNVYGGYEVWQDYTEDGVGEMVSVHQLLACLSHDPHEVFADENVVHHGNDNHPYLPEAEHKRANWEGNLEVMDSGEHLKHHDPLGIFKRK